MEVAVHAAIKLLLALRDPKVRHVLAIVLGMILAPLIIIIMAVSSFGQATSDHNNAIITACFVPTTPISEAVPTEYVGYIDEIRQSFRLLDSEVLEIADMIEGTALNRQRLKANFMALYFGVDNINLTVEQAKNYVDCYVTYETRTRTWTTTEIVPADPELGTVETTIEVTHTEEYTVAVPIEDQQTVFSYIGNLISRTVTDDDKSNADMIYNLAVNITGDDGTGDTLGGAIDDTLGDVEFDPTGEWCAPISGWRDIVTSEWGTRIDPLDGSVSSHSGIDFGCPTGTPIMCAKDGVVTTVHTGSGSYGNYVIVYHGDNIATLYAHNSQLLVSVGQEVHAGDVITMSGESGRVTGPHLHFEVRVNGTTVQPRNYLP